MQKLVLQLDVHDDLNCKQKAIQLVSSIPGIDSISMDIKAKKLTLIGDMDPIAVVKKLRRRYHSQIISVGPAKEPEKPKDAPKKPAEPKHGVPVIEFVHPMQAPAFRNNTYYVDPCYYSRYNHYGYPKSVEEDPAGCVIC